MEHPLVTLTTDFGLTDPSVGICKGVILSIAPDAVIVDVSHGIVHQSVLGGATLLAAALPYFPTGIHVAVVDPGVGTDRRPIVIRTGRGDFLIGPDNGLLMPAADALGGVAACHLLENPAYRLGPVSQTFHGRDIFSPAAAHLAAGVKVEQLGPAVDPASLVRLDVPSPRVEQGSLEAVVATVDSFGTAQLLAGPAELEAALGPLKPGDHLAIAIARSIASDAATQRLAATWRRTYGEAGPGELLVLVDSYGRLAIAVNMGSAERRHGLAPGARVSISRG